MTTGCASGDGPDMRKQQALKNERIAIQFIPRASHSETANNWNTPLFLSTMIHGKFAQEIFREGRTSAASSHVLNAAERVGLCIDAQPSLLTRIRDAERDQLS